MKHEISRGTTYKYLLSLAVTVLIITNFIGYVYSLNELSGPAFSDPSRIMEMPENWKKKPVRHDPYKENVDLMEIQR